MTRTDTSAATKLMVIRAKPKDFQADRIGTYSSHHTGSELLKCVRRWLSGSHLGSLQDQAAGVRLTPKAIASRRAVDRLGEVTARELIEMRCGAATLGEQVEKYRLSESNVKQ